MLQRQQTKRTNVLGERVWLNIYNANKSKYLGVKKKKSVKKKIHRERHIKRERGSKKKVSKQDQNFEATKLSCMHMMASERNGRDTIALKPDNGISFFMNWFYFLKPNLFMQDLIRLKLFR